MSSSQQHAAFVVYRGKTPGVYYSQEECQQQTEGNPKSKFQAFARAYDAELAWSEWQRKLYVKLGASTFLQQTAPKARPRLEAAYVPPPRTYSAPLSQEPVLKYEAHIGRGVKREPLEEMLPGRTNPGKVTYAQPATDLYTAYKWKHQYPSYQPNPASSSLPQNTINDKFEGSSPLPKHDPLPFGQIPNYNTPPPSSSPPIPPYKRPAVCIEISDDEEEMPSKRAKVADEYRESVLTAEERFELRQLDRHRVTKRDEEVEPKIELTPEQDKVVNLALRKSNIFMTGAAGSGKTVTLKEILKRIRKRKKGGNVEVVAPTGIAALPLDGKTTYSFAGVSIAHLSYGNID